MFDSFLARTVAKVRALLTEDWLGPAGDQFQKTTEAISEFSEQYIRPEERIREAPELLWNRAKGEANEKHSQSLVHFADEESKRIANGIAQRTTDDVVRQAKAQADKAEWEARSAETNEMMARIKLVDDLRARGLVPFWDKDGRMTVLKAPADFDWDGLSQRLLNVHQGEETDIAPLRLLSAKELIVSLSEKLDPSHENQE